MSAKRNESGALIQVDIEACRVAGFDFIVVLDDPNYYQRFGFTTASEFGLINECGVDAEFMVIQLTEICLTNTSGMVQFSKEFPAFS